MIGVFGVFLVTLISSSSLPAAEIFRVATYNLENYLHEPLGTRPAKSPRASRCPVESNESADMTDRRTPSSSGSSRLENID